MDALKIQHEELLVADEELRAQIEELQRVDEMFWWPIYAILRSRTPLLSDASRSMKAEFEVEHLPRSSYAGSHVPGASNDIELQKADFTLLTVGDAAAILGLSVDMVRVLHRKGHLPAFLTPRGQRLFKRCDVERLARERRAR